MPNDYFRFKQFLIRQGQCAMKVCTDSCILGAWARVERAQRLLDIGTGTGLLALMAAQRSQGHITALEIDAAAAAQARENARESPWSERIAVRHQSLQDFGKENNEAFDLILCNPPFYPASQKSPDAARNVAMHSHDLSFEEIICFCGRFLSPEGQLYVLLPPAESLDFEQAAKTKELFPEERLLIYTRTQGRHIRTIQVYSRRPVAALPETILNIRDAENHYTEAFRQLLLDYYLIF